MKQHTSAVEDTSRSERAPDRLSEMLVRYLGPAVLPAFEDDDVTEVYVNPQDGAVRVDTRSRGKVDTGAQLAPHRVEMLLNAVAANVGATLTPDAPRLEAEPPTPRPRDETLMAVNAVSLGVLSVLGLRYSGRSR